MKKILLLVILAGLLSVYSQDTIVMPRIIIEGYAPEPVLMRPNSNDRALIVDTTLKPTIRIDGTPDPLTTYLQKNITYPDIAIELGISEMVWAMFTVEKSGEITNVHLLRNVYDTLGAEVIKVLEKIPDFPRMDESVSFIVPFKFILRNGVVRNRTLAKPEEINGDWKCVQKDRYIIEEYYEPDVEFNNIRISNDTIWHFEYPNRFYGQRQFIANSDWSIRTNTWFQHDTLVIHNLDSRHDGFHYYLRDTFDQKVIDQLLVDTIYLPSLFGKWYVETERPDDVEYGPPIRLTYPVYVPPVFKFDETDIAGKRMIWLNINGTKRKFRVNDCSLNFGFIELESFEWSKKTLFITYFTEKRDYDKHGNRK
jgi:hypothetical protein